MKWIETARATARRIASERGQVTINDVRAICPPPIGCDPRIMGSVLMRTEFERIGFAPSERGICHGRMIGVFKLKQV